MDKFLTHAWFKPPDLSVGNNYVSAAPVVRGIMNYELPIILTRIVDSATINSELLTLNSEL